MAATCRSGRIAAAAHMSAGSVLPSRLRMTQGLLNAPTTGIVDQLVRRSRFVVDRTISHNGLPTMSSRDNPVTALVVALTPTHVPLDSTAIMQSLNCWSADDNCAALSLIHI